MKLYFLPLYPENDPQEEELQSVSKQIVDKVVRQAVHQYTQERKHKGKKEAKAKKGSLLEAAGSSRREKN
uniref:A-kinase anchor protein 7 RI-RII subunit-binding domain-containing protein n=1 Tax=Callorhinchus milii TaxID=7868 RepID=A0A4W3JG42_CALMI